MSGTPRRRSRRAEREARLEKLIHRRHRILLGTGLAVALVISLGAFAITRPSVRLGPTAVAPAIDPEIDALLRRLRGGIARRSLDRVIPASISAERCAPQLAVILARPDHRLFSPAVVLTVHLDLTMLAPALRSAMASLDASGRAAVIRAVEQLDPWRDEELLELMRDEQPAVVAAALTVAAARPQPPFEALAELLLAEDPAVRAAALAALPESLPADFGDRLADGLLFAPADRTSEALRALAGCPQNNKVAGELYAPLESGGDNAGCTLDALASRGEPLERPDLVLALACSQTNSIRDRARAILCFERTGTSTDLDELSNLWPQHPVLDYFAARVLLLAGRQEAVRLLIRVTRAAREHGEEAHLVEEARIGATQLLAMLSGTSVSADPSVWDSWANAQPQLVVAGLPPVTVDLGR